MRKSSGLLHLPKGRKDLGTFELTLCMATVLYGGVGEGWGGERGNKKKTRTTGTYRRPAPGGGGGGGVATGSKRVLNARLGGLKISQDLKHPKDQRMEPPTTTQFWV